ncbi:MAG TPA: stage II sporulation protein P [Caproiciproducens sp.]|nr:stage II sporulation protein P [Caproiciproducens sp.]
MKKWSQKAAQVCSAALAVTAVLCVASRLPEVLAQNTALTAAGFILPGGAPQAMQSILEEDEEDGSYSPEPNSSAPENTASSAPTSSAPASSAPLFSVPSVSGSPQSSAGSAPASSSSGPVVSQSSAPVKEMAIVNAGTQYNNIWVKNTNQNHSIDIAAELAKTPAVKIKKNSAPQVLIYHTHTTEAYYGDTRTTDLNRSVVAVGEQIAKQLKAAGINVVHDTTVHDYPTYNGSYDRSKVTIQNDLKQYPSVQVTLDVHRDAMGTADGTRIKPTAVINGKKAAQIMIISGCDDTGKMGFPNWEYNLRLGVRLQKSLTDLYPGVARPLNFCARKYNENLTKGSLLVEFGTEVNTLDEAKYSGELFGKALAAELGRLS